MEIYEVLIERITPTWIPREDSSSDERWFRRSTVRTFKVAAKDQEELDHLANDLLEAFLKVEGGIASWTTRRWFNRPA